MKKSVEEIFKSIEYYHDSFPKDEIKELLDRREETKNFLVEYIKEFKGSIFRYLNEEDYIGHIYAVIILAQFKEKELCAIFLELLRLPGTKAFELFDTVIPEYGARIIASVYDNNIENILRLLNDKKANEYAKAIAVQALKVLCINGEISKEEVEDFLISLLEGKLKDKKHVVLLEILYTAFELDMKKVLDLLKDNCKKGEYMPVLSLSEVEAEIKLYNDGLYINEGINDVHNQEILDAYKELNDIFKSIAKENDMKKQVESLQDKIAVEISIIGRKFQRGIRSKKLEEHLKVLSKEDLYKIGKHLGLKGYYKLKKNELVGEIYNNYEELIKGVLRYFDEERILELKEFLRGESIIKIEKSSQFNAFFYFERYGLVYPFVDCESTAFMMPDEIKKIIKDIMLGFTFRKEIKRNSEIISLVKGMIEAYGIMKKSDIVKMLSLYDINESEEYKRNVVDEGSGLYYSMLDRNYIINGDIDSHNVVSEIEENMIKDDYKFFDKKELIAMASDDWTETISYAEDFYREFEDKFVIDKENFIEMINDMKANVQITDPQSIIQLMVDSVDSKCSSETEVEELKEAKKTIRDLAGSFLENVPLWKYKGRCMKDINN